MQRTSEDLDWANASLARAHAANDVLRRELTARDADKPMGRTTIAGLRAVLREFPDADTSGLWVPADEALAADDRRDELAKSRRRWIDAFDPIKRDGSPDEHLVALEALVDRLTAAEQRAEDQRERAKTAELALEAATRELAVMREQVKRKPDGHDPAVRLPVLPATCGECEHRETVESFDSGHVYVSSECWHPDRTKTLQVTKPEPPPTWCPLRQKEG